MAGNSRPSSRPSNLPTVLLVLPALHRAAHPCRSLQHRSEGEPAANLPRARFGCQQHHCTLPRYGEKVTPLQYHSLLKTTGLAALAQTLFIPSWNHTKHFHPSAINGCTLPR